METKKYSRLTYKERVIIETLLSEEKSRTFIAKQLNRSKSTITRELKKWIGKLSDKNKYKYSADLADWDAKDDYLNKRNLDKIATYKSLKIYVYRGLLKQPVNEQSKLVYTWYDPFDGYLRIAHEAIYTHI